MLPRLALIAPLALVTYACAAPTPDVVSDPIYVLGTAELSGDFGPYETDEGPASIESWSETTHLKVSREIEGGYVLAILTASIALPTIAPGIYADLFSMVRLCSGPAVNQFAYDRNADEVVTTVTMNDEGKRFVVEAWAVGVDEVDRTVTTFSMVAE